MNYANFKDSLSKNTFHIVSKKAFKPSEDCFFNEPSYLLQSSGSHSKKTFIHTLSSIKAASSSFFKQFAISESDRWGLCLSTEHVAGFSILARSHFGEMKDPYSFKWCVEHFKNELELNEVTIVSLVPTQVFDLVKNNIKPPCRFKFLFIGGGFISKDLIDEAIDLGWPVVVCYGSTDTFAQMSFSSDGEFYKPYKNWQIRISESKEIELKGEGLYSAEVLESGEILRRNDEWFLTGDSGEIEGEWFALKGKLSGLVKIKGSYFDFNLFKKKLLDDLNLEDLSVKSTFPVVLQENRNGAGIYLVTTQKINELSGLLERNSEIKGVFKIKEDVFSAIGKIQKSKLEDVLSKTILCL